MHDPTAEATRWWEQALDDRLFVQTMAREARFFDKACFIAQQAAEKAVKACLYAQGKREVLGHAVLQFTRDLARSEPMFIKIATQAARLDRHYIPTRYPNGLPGGTPSGSFSAGDLSVALQDLEAIFAVAEEYLRTRKVIE
jgi:HEPN domain-containing protein